MSNFKASSLLAALTTAVSVAAHGHVTNIVINGVSYETYNPFVFPYEANPPTVVGWTASDTDNGFVDPTTYASGDIACHKAATNAGGHAQVAAGDSISIQWDTWPESHKGPMLDYLAACNGPCESADKTALEFFKIDEAGILDSSAAPGTWASDVLIANNNTWLVQIPATLKAGNYVLRHETIALHSAGSANGAQNYPQCFNLEVTGAGTDVPAGVLATELYTPTDPGIEVNIYVAGLDYQIPGPALIAGVSSTVSQVSSAITGSASATVGSGSGSATSATTTTTKASSSSTTTVAKPTTTLVTSVRTTTSAAQTTAKPTSLTTTTKAVTTSATKTQTAVVAAQTLYGQCGGINWTGATTCAQGTCTEYNPYYAQCVEDAVAAAAVTTIAGTSCQLSKK